MEIVSPKRSRIMASVKSSGNKSTEVAFATLLRGEHLAGWRRHYPLVGHPDFVFPRIRLAIFVDGCFWHGCPKHCRMPKTNRKYWKEKIGRNVMRDRAIKRRLALKGWRVIRLWEHDVRRRSPKMRKLKKIIRQGKSSAHGKLRAERCC